MKQVGERIGLLNDRSENKNGKYVLYWMQMYKRATHNHALNFAVELANDLKLPLVVYEGLKYYYPWANDRIHTFILEGVEEKRAEFAARGIRYIFYLQKDKASLKNTVAQLARDAAAIVTDDFPCFIVPHHNQVVAERAEIPVYAVDSNGIIPMSKFEKEEYAAYTIRPKIRKLWPEYSKPFEDARVKIDSLKLKIDCPDIKVTDKNIAELVAACDIDHSVKPSPLYRGGSGNARARLKLFLKEIFPDYDETRNEASVDGSSRLSMYLHFGFISVYEIVEAVNKLKHAPKESKKAFLEELVVRRELSFNFTRHNAKYDSLECLPAWVQQTMREHVDDKREFIYSLEELENCQTHDEIWNAAQRELVETGGMHNYVRMLWGKNVIAWTKSYEEAFAILEHLNNKYALDGRDPNSYAGILWCFGKHDRPWFERPVFGKIRYMNSNGTARKIDAPKYIQWSKTLVRATKSSLF
ncbi:MAG TPA: deoxyribodipyrimidine photo-lyase [Pyrinomonadaceae bacterium]|nr:deoxyribodipyrimidine photo-lyase [Pyrinomonadaceae bacterium]